MTNSRTGIKHDLCIVQTEELISQRLAPNIDLGHYGITTTRNVIKQSSLLPSCQEHVRSGASRDVLPAQ